MITKKTLINLLLVFSTSLIVGCTGRQTHQKYSAPSIANISIPVEKTKSAISKARYALDKQDYQETKKNLVEAEKHTQDVEAELEKHQVQVEEQTKQLNEAIDLKNKAEQRAEVKAKEAHQNAKERDVLVYLWSIFFALWLLATVGAVVDLLPPQYRIAGKIIFLLLGFGVGYALGRFILRWLAYLFP